MTTSGLPESDADVFEMLDRERLSAAFRDGRFAWVEVQEGLAGTPPLRRLDAAGGPGQALAVIAEADDVRTLTEAALAWTETALSDEERADVYEDLDPDDLEDRALCRTCATQRLWDRLTLFGAFDFVPADALSADHVYLAQLTAHAGAMTPLFAFIAAPPYQNDAFAVVRLLR